MDYYDILLAKKLGGGGGGGGSSAISLLDEVTITEGVRSVNIDFTELSSYDVLFVFVDFTMSANDWLGFKVNSNEPNGSYDSRSINHKHVPFISVIRNDGQRANAGLGLDGGGATSLGALSNLLMYAYNATTTITGKYQIYGGKYADM